MITADRLTARSLIVCFSAALFFFYEFIQMNLINAISDDLMRALSLDAFKLAQLTSIYFISNVIFLFPAGMLLDRYSTKKLILIALGLCVLGTAGFACVQTFTQALAVRFLTGIGSAFCFVSCFRLASRWIPPRHMALITGLIVTFAMTGGVISQVPFAWLSQSLDWRSALYWDAAFGLLIMMVIMILVQDNPPQMEKVHCKNRAALLKIGFLASLKAAYLKPDNIAAGLYTSLMNMPIGLLGVFMGTIYLQQTYHLNKLTATSVTQWLFIGTIIGGPLIGKLSDTLAMRRLPMIAGAILAFILSIILLSQTQFSVRQLQLLFFGIGFFTAAQVISYPLVAENNHPAITAMAVSLVSILTQGGVSIYEVIAGKLLMIGWNGQSVAGVPQYSATQYHFALMMIPVGIILALLACFVIRETHARSIH